MGEEKEHVAMMLKWEVRQACEMLSVFIEQQMGTSRGRRHKIHTDFNILRHK